MLTEREKELQARLDAVNQILQVRAGAHMNEIVNAIEIRKAQALAGNMQARLECAALLQAIEPDSLKAAALGIATPRKDGTS